MTDLIKLKGTVYWAQVRNKNDLSGKYQIDLQVDEESKTILAELNITTKNKGDDRGDFITLKSEYPPKVVDKNRNIIPENVKVGNGSKVLVVAHPFEWNFKGKKGVSVGMRTVQVLELVEYTKDSGDELLEGAVDDSDLEGLE